jgi:hypothetical protein
MMEIKYYLAFGDVRRLPLGLTVKIQGNRKVQMRTVQREANETIRTTFRLREVSKMSKFQRIA